MRLLFFLILSCFTFSQTPTDSIEIPTAVKADVEKIISNTNENKVASEELKREINKQIKLMKEIRARISKLEAAPKAKKITSNEMKNSPLLKDEGIKPSSIYLEVDGQIVQWDPINRSWFGRLLHKDDVVYYPFIVDKDGNKIYLKF